MEKKIQGLGEYGQFLRQGSSYHLYCHRIHISHINNHNEHTNIIDTQEQDT